MPANSGEAARSAVIVMADDNPEACLEATKTLQAAGLGNPLTYVTNRAALMDHLHGRHVFGGDVPAPRPDLVLIDLDGPEIDGRQVLAEIADAPALHDLPVIALSASKGGPSGSAARRRGRAGVRIKADRFRRACRGGRRVSVIGVAPCHRNWGTGRRSRRL